MAAANTDLLMEVGDPGTATTLSSPGYTVGDPAINVASTSNWPTATGVVFAIDEAEVINNVEVQVPGTYNEYVGTTATGTSITTVEWVRGVGDRNYSAGALTRVYVPVSAERENRIVEWGTLEHTQTGTHVMARPKVTTSIDDTNGNELIKVTATASAVNEVTVANAATTGRPKLAATGGDTNVDLELTGQGTGGAILKTRYRFRVYRNVAANTGAAAYAVIAHDTEQYDTNSNVASGVYTVPLAGFYYFAWNATATLSAGADETLVASLHKNGTEVSCGNKITYRGVQGSSGSDLIQCAAGDTIDVRAFAPVARPLQVGTAAQNFFSGYLVSLV